MARLPSTDLTLYVPLKRCSRCRRTIPVTWFTPRCDRPGNSLSACRSCVAARVRESYVPRPKPAPEFPGHKRCGRCKQVLPIDAFEKRGDGRPGVRAECRDCRHASKREYGEAHRDQLRASARAYYRANTAKINARIKATVAANPDLYRAIHSDWKRRNKDAVNASTHKRRARLTGNHGSWSRDDWERLKARFDWRCLMCGKQEVTDGITLCFDHVIPLDLGGFNIISNGQPLCRPCNARKGTAVLDFRVVSQFEVPMLPVAPAVCQEAS